MTVTLELLFPHLDDLIQTPADVQRLNEAILQLAVQGKLVPQDPHDEPASELLRRIAVKKAQLITKGKLKRTVSLPSITDDETPFTLPSGWIWVRLDTICYVGTGSTPRRDEAKYYENGRTPWITSSVTGKPFITEASEYISEEALKETNCQVYPKHTLIVALYGQGKTRGQISELLIEAATNQACAALVFAGFSDELQPYVKIYFQKIYQELRSLAEGGAQPNLNVGKVKETILPLPPLAEQKRIVAKVDELFAQTRALAAKLRRAQEAIVVVNRAVLHHLHHAADPATFQHATQILGDHFDLLYTDPRPVTDLRQTILQLAVQGKLVPQDPHDEPAGELLKRIAVEKERLVAEGKVGKEKPLPPIDEDEIPFVLPMGWEWVRLGWLVKSMTNGLYKPSGFYTDRGIISLRMFNIQDGVINLDGAKRLEVTPEELNNYALEKGDLLINRVNSKELVGKAALIKATGENMVFESMNIRVRLMEKANLPEYLNLLLRSSYIQEAFRGLAKQAIGQASVNQLQIASLAIPIPPLAEQKRIVAKVDELLARCAALERKLGQAQVAGRQLTAAVLQGVVG